jgi:transcription elongation factor GreA
MTSILTGATARARGMRRTIGRMHNAMTPEGLEALRAELAELEGPRRQAIAAEIKTARDFGDLKENAEYHAAKDAQGHLEAKIRRLRERLETAEVVEHSGGDVIAFGSTVEVEDVEGGKRSTYTIVSSLDASPTEGKLSAESPLATALAGLKQGDQAVFRSPRGERRMIVRAVR